MLKIIRLRKARGADGLNDLRLGVARSRKSVYSLVQFNGLLFVTCNGKFLASSFPVRLALPAPRLTRTAYEWWPHTFNSRNAVVSLKRDIIKVCLYSTMAHFYISQLIFYLLEKSPALERTLLFA